MADDSDGRRLAEGAGPRSVVLLCPGQGAQQVGMGRAWADRSRGAAQTFAAADEALSDEPAFKGTRLSELCFEGPVDRLGRTDVSQPALFTAAVACWQGLVEQWAPVRLHAAAGLSLGEYTALHLAGAIGFIDALRLVALRGRLMQEAAEASEGGMVALIGADEAAATALCSDAASGEVLVPANFNAPGQIVVSGHRTACARAVDLAGERGLRASMLQVAGAFHSPLMQPAADRLAEALDRIEFAPLQAPVWSNVTGRRHERDDPSLLRKRLVEQLVQPVRWSEGCSDLLAALRTEASDAISLHELAPGSVLRGLMRRIDRSFEVTSHDQPPPPADVAT
jgi:[acyl-carrier-protein] S-malonyltransferase